MNGLALDVTMAAVGLLFLAVGLIWWAYATRLEDCMEVRPWRLSDRTTPLDPPPPPVDRYLWNGEVWTDPRDLLADSDAEAYRAQLQAAKQRHPSRQGRA